MTSRSGSPVLDVAGAAAYLGISRRTLYRLSAAQGQGRAGLPVIHLSPGRRGFLQSDLDAYLRRQRLAKSA